MKAYLTAPGLDLLRSALASRPSPPNLFFTGLQVGSLAGFVPVAETSVKGDVLVDKTSDAAAVKITLLSKHETIVSAVLDRDLEFASVGNILFFLNGIPTLWLVADTPLTKLKTNPVSHFAGEKAYLSIVFRFPYLRSLLLYDPSQGLHSVWPIFATVDALTIPEHTPNEQVVVEDNDLYYGRHQPFMAVRHDHHWLSFPLMRPVDENFYKIDGGTVISGM